MGGYNLKTVYEMSDETKEAFIRFAKERSRYNDVIPQQFIKKMKTNTGSISDLTTFGKDENGLERKNPLIVALGDSVTAGHFEWNLSSNEKMRLFQEGNIDFSKPLEVHDAREAYHEKFRKKLIDLFELTSVSVINAGIAGDTIYGMAARLERDVLRYDPDLVLINGSLNWPEESGSIANFEQILQDMVQKVKIHTDSDIILMTPNLALPNPLSSGNSMLVERVKMIRQVAMLEQVCLVDTYAVWEEFVNQGYNLKEMFANGINHPTPAGHEVYAIELMKLFH